jgi:DNA invertase Pin-like site-specific DNA recombinase
MHPLMTDLTGKTLDELLKTINETYKKISFAGKMGNTAMLNQLRMVADTYQEEINKRYRAEANAAKENPIFKDSLDIG